MLTDAPAKWTFESLIEGHEPITRHSFKEAAKDMMEYVRNLLAGEGVSFQVLETGLWIVQPTRQPLYFYEVRDIACEAGWLVNGKWVD